MLAKSNNSENKMPIKPVICIPGVFANIKEDRIRRIFGDLNLGDVERIDIVIPKNPIGTDKKENKFNRVFIHLNWNDTPSSVACREKLLQGKEVKIIYDTPWFWRVSAYRPPALKPIFYSQNPKVFQQKKAMLDLDFDLDVKYSSVIASGLNITPPQSVVSCRYKPEIDNADAPIKCYNEFGTEIKEETTSIDYGKSQAPKKKRGTVIKIEDEDNKDK